MPETDHADYSALLEAFKTNPDAIESSQLASVDEPAVLFARAESFEQIAAIERAFA